MPAPIGNKFARQKRSKKAKDLAHAFVEARSKGVKKTAYQILVEGGFSKWSARNAKRTLKTDSFQEEMKKNGGLDRMKYAQELAVSLSIDKLEGKSYHLLVGSPSELASISKTYVHDIQLLSGAETDRIKTDVAHLKSIGNVLEEISAELRDKTK